VADPVADTHEGTEVERAQQDLLLMVSLQQIYVRISDAIRERQTPPQEVLQLQQENRRRQEELEELEEQVNKHTEELKEVRKKEGEFKVELEHFQGQKAQVTNEREFTAVISEIDYATKALEESTTRREALEGTIEALNQDIAARKETRPEEEATHKEVSTSWEKRKDELKQVVHQLAEDAERVQDQLRPKHRANFLRLLESKRGTPMAAVVEGSCSLCHFSLRPHLQQRVRRGEEIISCEHCYRILFMPDVCSSQDPGAESA